MNGLISCFHGHRKSCQSQYVRCYKSKPPTRALRHAPSTHSFACKHLHRKKQTHIRCNPLSQFCAKLMTLETLRRKLQYCVDIKYQNKYAQDIFFSQHSSGFWQWNHCCLQSSFLILETTADKRSISCSGAFNCLKFLSTVHIFSPNTYPPNFSKYESWFYWGG